MSLFFHWLVSIWVSLNIQNFAPNDWVDVLIIAALVYVILRLLFEQRSLSVAIGILALGALYWISTIFNLPLTHLLLKTFFGFFIIFLAIIFQKELRRLFSFVGFFSFQRGTPPAHATIETISQASAKLSRGKIGALIVFPGKESITRHFEKGVALHGDISQELLLSIFSEETPGHDGAIIIVNNKLWRFGVHLPLAEDVELGKFGGLRHRAALGLAERSDALTIVVSGETGSIDVAHHGAWKHCANEDELRALLFEFSHEISPKESTKHLSVWFKRNAGMFAGSLVIAAVMWIFFSPNFAPTQKSFTVPLEFKNVPEGYVVQDVVPREAVITLQGQNSDFDSLSPQSLDVSVDLSAIQDAGWKTVHIAPQNADIPINFSVIKVGPPSIQVDIVKQ
jgi:uncharacterized protein (TIGR00159 family)